MEEEKMEGGGDGLDDSDSRAVQETYQCLLPTWQYDLVNINEMIVS